MDRYLQPGEEGIYVRPDSKLYGSELTVTGRAELRKLIHVPTGSHKTILSYVVDCPAMGPPPEGYVCWLVPVEYVRRKPPKQDWKSLCSLDDVKVPA